MFLQIYHLIDEQKCYEEVRRIRWPNGVHCPHCDAKLVRKRGFHSHQAHRRAAAVRHAGSSSMI